MRGLALGALVACACGGAAPQTVAPAPVTAPAIAPVGPRHPGGTVRVTVSRAHGGFLSVAGVWLHHEQGQEERLEIMVDGRFDWHIDRNGSVCEIAGTVAYVDGVPPAPPSLAWTMTTNTCNSSYQGKTASDNITEHSDDHLTLKDAEFDLAPVPYDRER